jgi:hypothetical protein
MFDPRFRGDDALIANPAVLVVAMAPLWLPPGALISRGHS